METIIIIFIFCGILIGSYILYSYGTCIYERYITQHHIVT